MVVDFPTQSGGLALDFAIKESNQRRREVLHLHSQCNHVVDSALHNRAIAGPLIRCVSHPVTYPMPEPLLQHVCLIGGSVIPIRCPGV